MRQHSQVRERARDFVRAAQQQTQSKHSAPALTHILINQMREEVDADEEVSCLVLSAGWSAIVREALKGYEMSPSGSYDARDGDGGEDLDEAGPARQRQFELWPERCRADLEEIGRAAIFVPSRGEHVPLMPDDVTPDEIKEAGLYLMQKGEDCLKRGRALVRLSRVLKAA